MKIRLKKPSAATGLALRQANAAPEIIVAGAACRAAACRIPAAAPPRQRSGGRSAEDLHLVKSPIVGTYYGSPSPGAEPFVEDRRIRRNRTDPLHRRSHEAYERNRIRHQRRSAAHLRRKRTAGGVRPAAVRHPSEPEEVAGPPAYVPENPSRQPRGNCPADHLRVQRAWAFRRSPFIPKRTAIRCTFASRTKPSASDRRAAAESYLNIPQVISAAEITNVDAIHPGYGFLSENANFAKVCEASEITFIGPTAEVIEIMGEKDRARREVKAAGLPTVPGSDGIVEGEDQLAKEAAKIGYPLILKAVAGGGGRGMRIVRKQEELLSDVSDRAQRGAAGLRHPRRLRREIHRASAPHRVSGARRPAWQGHSSRRTRVHHPAAAPETAGRVSVAGDGSQAAQGTRRQGGARAGKDRLHQRRHRRISDGRRRLDLFHRDEYAHSGGASGHGDWSPAWT